MPASVEQYRQVAMTYLRRPAFARLLVPSFVAWIAWLAWKVYSGDPRNMWTRRGYYAVADYLNSLDRLFFFLPFFVVFSYVAIWMGHVREQLATPRGFLVPNYRMRHLAVAAVAFLAAPVVGVAVTLITQYCVGFTGPAYPLGMFAVALTLLTPAAWLASLRSPWMALLTIPAISILAFGTPVGVFFDGLVEGHLWSVVRTPYVPLVSVQLILLNLVILGLLFYRLMHMRPDARSGSPEAMPEPRNRITPLPLIRHKPILSAMARIWHRRRGVLDPGAPWAVAILLALLLVGFTLIHGANHTELIRSLLLPACVPGAIVSIVWRERLMNLQFESLYPATHTGFISELLGAAALSLAEMWISTMVAVLAPILIWHSELANQMPLVVAVIVATAVMQLLVFGVMLIASVHLRGTAILYANILTIIAIVIPIESAIEPFPSLSPSRLIVLALIEAAIGALLTLYGTHAWRRADLA